MVYFELENKVPQKSTINHLFLSQINKSFIGITWLNLVRYLTISRRKPPGHIAALAYVLKI